MKRKYTKELLEPIVMESDSIRKVLIALNLKHTGGNHNHIKTLIEKFDIDTSHIKGQAWNKDLSPSNKRTKEQFINEYLVKDGPKTATNYTKSKLLEFGLKNNVCEICGQIPWWNNKLLVLQLDHIDGDNRNNELSNLRIVCSNCHTQTETFAGKNVNKKQRPIVAIRISTGDFIRYDSVKDAAESLKISSIYILKVINGKQKSSKGYKFKLA